MKYKKPLLLSLLLFGVLCHVSHAADVLMIDRIPNNADLKEKVKLACKFYGLDLKYLILDDKKNTNLEELIEKDNSIRAFIIAPGAIGIINNQKIFDRINKNKHKNIKILIIGLTSEVDLDILERWTLKPIIKSINYANTNQPAVLKVNNNKELVHELAGQNLQYISGTAYYLDLDENPNIEIIISVLNGNKEKFPLFIKTKIYQQELFIQTKVKSNISRKDAIYHNNNLWFAEFAPLMVFLRYSCKERCWHSERDFANFTIDDPWLTEQYGHLNYGKLLEEMQKINFHTTIAFVAWNFDRSEPEVASLLRRHLDRFSICMHGNNHDHYEFYKYETKAFNPWEAKPLNVHEANIKQALARMEKFKESTGIPYDKVMIFPHGIAPAKTLGLLKKYNFLGTINMGHIPLESEEPPDPLFHFRQVTLHYDNFPSINRYSPAQRTPADLAIDLFLDNPIFLMGHHNLFEEGMDSFNKTAQKINNIQPNVIWQSPGYIIRHLYFKKLRDDGKYDVLAFSNEVIIENTQEKDLEFFMQKEESFSPMIRKVLVDEKSFPYNRKAKKIIIKIFIPGGESRHVRIEYDNALNINGIDISKKELNVHYLRKISDFRDITLSSNKLGRFITKYYYYTGLYKLGIARLAVIFISLLIVMVITGWIVKRRFWQKPI